MKRWLLALIASGCLASGSALPQTAGDAGSGASPGAAPLSSVGSTRTGGLPERAGATTAVGQTKPPGTAVGDGLGTRPDLEEKSRRIDRQIQTGICSGCQ
jgi:hypothetical protein